MSTNENNSTKGSVTNPYTEEEMNSMMDEGTWTGGYVEGMGYVGDDVTVWGTSGSDTSDSESSDSWDTSEDNEPETPSPSGGGGGGGGTEGNNGKTFPTPPNKQDSGPCVRVFTERVFKSELSTLSRFTAVAYNAVGDLLPSTILEGYFLERVVNYDSACVEGSNTAILKGEYDVIPKESWQSYQWYLENVPGRSGIAIHSGNTYEDTEGCLLTGSNYIKNNDGTYRVTDSKKCLEKLFNLFTTYGSNNIKISITENF